MIERTPWNSKPTLKYPTSIIYRPNKGGVSLNIILSN